MHDYAKEIDGSDGLVEARAFRRVRPLPVARRLDYCAC